MIDVLLLVIYTAAAGIATWSLVRVLFADRPAWWRMAVATGLFPVLIAIELTALGVMGWLSPHVGGIVMVVLALPLWFAGRRKSVAVPRGGIVTDSLSREAAMAAAVLAGAVLPPVARALLAGPQFGYDDYSYHAPFVTQWMLDGRISLLAFNYHAYFPFNAELFSLWFMLPVGTDTYVGFGGVFWTIAAAASVTGLAISLGRRIEGALLAAALCVVSTLVAITALRFSANDLAPTVMIATSIVALTGDGRGRRVADVIVAGLLIGFGLGAKLTMLPAVAVVAVAIAFYAPGGKLGVVRIGHVALFAAGILIATGYWYGRNWLLTGNPFFPGAIGPFPGPLGAEVRDQTKLFTFLLADPVGTLRTALPPLTDWPVILWLVSVAGYLRGLVALFRKSPGRLPASGTLEPVLLLIGIALLLGFPFQPFSGTTNQPGTPITPEPRFLIASYMAGIVLASRWIVGTRGVVAAAVVVVAGGLLGNQPAGIAAGVLGLGAWFGASSIERALRFVRRHRTIVFAAIVMALAAFSVMWRGGLEREIERRVFSYRSSGQPMGPLWSEVNNLPPGSKVVAFGLAGNFSYPLFGRSLDLRPVMVGRAGDPLLPVHELYLPAPGRFDWWASPPDSAELARLTPGLISIGATHVAVSRTASGVWPVQASILVPPHFTVVHSDPGSALFRVNR